MTKKTVEDTIFEYGTLLTRDPNGRVIEIRSGGQWVYLENKDAPNVASLTEPCSYCGGNPVSQAAMKCPNK